MKHVKPGTLIADRYEVKARLGRGGMGVVYLADQVSLGRDVAIKMLRPEFSVEEEDRARFQREARVMSRLRHRNAVDVFDYGTWEDQLFLVMELLDGLTLRARMTDDVPYDFDESLRIAWELADVLVAAHDLSLVHRDLKPENVMLQPRTDGTERVVVVDFGLAFMHSSDPETSRLTTAGLVSGTPQYMSPEQARGADNLGPAVDIYALGGMLFELVTGSPPFRARRRIDLINEHLFVEAPSMRDAAPPGVEVPYVLNDLVKRMLRKASFDRPDALEVRDTLGALMTGDVSRGRGRPDRLNEPRSRRIPTRDGRAFEDSEGEVDGLAETLAVPAFEDDAIAFVGVTRPMPLARTVSFRAAGFAPVSLDAAHLDVILVDSESDPLGHVDLGVPVVAEVALEVDLSEITNLLRGGVADVIRGPADDAAVIRKVRRAMKTHQRRSQDAGD